jgi:hypothetical protein
MSGLEPLAIAALVGGTAASAGSKLMAAGQQSAAADFESQQYAAQADAAKTASLQEETVRRRDLVSNLETIAAIRAGRGVGSGSPTAMAIYGNSIDRSEDDIATSKANYASKVDLANRASILSDRKSSTSLLAGFLGAAGDIAGGAFKYGAAKGGFGSNDGTGFSTKRTGGLY